MSQIIPTAEPFIFPGQGENARTGYLVTHGFTGTPKEVRWFDKDAYQQHVAYPRNPVRSGLELRYVIEEMHKALPKIGVPVLLIHSRDDGYVFKDSMERIYQSLGTTDKQMLWVEGGGHVMTEEPTRERVFKAAADFIQRVSLPA